MIDRSLFSVYLYPIQSVIRDPTLGNVLMHTLFAETQAMGCLLCSEDCSPDHRFPPLVVVAYDTNPDQFHFMSLLCAKCCSEHHEPDLRSLVFAKIKEHLMPDAKMVTVHAPGSA
jgi:hypothetical protein